jgi:2,3-bisphosphoglycerate-independent phosphoglycerate mutase
MPEKMRYVIIVGDGMADYPIEALGGKTPLMVAATPHMDWLAQHGELGLVKTIPDGLTPGSEVANLSIMGYDPASYLTGRGPIEAASLGIKLQPDDIAFRCNLVTLGYHGRRMVMEDFAAGHITDEEAKTIILDLDHELGTDEFRFYSGVSYRHVMNWQGGAAMFPDLERMALTPPHDILDQDVLPYLPPKGRHPGDGGGERLLALMERSQEFLADHPVNRDRISKKLKPANSIWLWGQGRFPKMATLTERFGLEGYVISAVHLVKGIGIFAGLGVLDVPGATGYFDTNYDGKAQYALRALKDRDMVYVHVEAPDEAGHMGDVQRKVDCIEVFDAKIVGPILKGLEGSGRYKVLVMPDHPTPISLRTHTADPIPYVIYSSEDGTNRFQDRSFDEGVAKETGVFIEKGFQLIERFLRLNQERGRSL